MTMTLFPTSRLFRYLFIEALPFVLLTLFTLTLLILTQQITRQSDLLFTSTSSALLSLRIILYLLPGILVITLPFSLLIGSLIALNRLSSDNEIISARASGISVYKIFQPFILYGVLGLILSGYLTIQVVPRLISSVSNIKSEIVLAILSAPIKPQTFNTQFPNHLVYTKSVDPTNGDWLGVFIIRNQEGGQSLILTSQRGRLRITQNTPLTLEIQLSDGLLLSTNINTPQKQTITSFQQQEIKLSSENPAITQAIEKGRSLQELSISQLTSQGSNAVSQQERRQARVELHKRFSLPFACLILIILAVPLGMSSSRQTGRAVAFTIGFSIAILYYLVLIAGQNLALSGTLPAWLGAWLPNLLGGLFAFIRFVTNPIGSHTPKRVFMNPGIKKLLNLNAKPISVKGSRRPVFLSLINYLLVSELTKYFLIAISILVSTSLIFTLLDILPALNRSGLGWNYGGTYLLFLSPQLLYYVTPFAVLLTVLTTHGLLMRSNQITALLASGQSILRLIFPLVFFVLFIIACLFWLSENILPQANREQDDRYNRIKGRKSEQSILALGRYWVQGEDDVIYGFQFNSTNNKLLNTTVYRINKQPWKLDELVHAQEASAINQDVWQVEKGWHYKIDQHNQLTYQSLPTATPTQDQVQISGGINTLRRIVNESSKMNFNALRSHIRYLSRLGTSTSSLRVDLEKKLAFPFSCIPLLSLAFPLALRSNRRGTFAGVGLSIIVGLTFWITASFIEGLGRQAYLPAGLSVWGAQALFVTLGIFLIFRLKR